MQRWITSAADYVQDNVIAVAKEGVTHYTLEHPVDCLGFIWEKTEGRHYGLHEPPHIIKTLEECEGFVDKVRKRVVKRFPDSDITFDEKTKIYTIKWD